MANDGGIMAVIEQAIADKLAALQYVVGEDTVDVFKTAEVWTGQTNATKGGVEKFLQYAPFAFVSFIPPDEAREGDYNLREMLLFAVAIGQVSKKDGVARIGDATHLGISKLYDYVLGELDGKHPGVGIISNDLYFAGTDLLIKTPRAYAMQIYFKCDLIRDNA